MTEVKFGKDLSVCVLRTISAGGVTLLDAVKRDADGLVDLFFTHDTDLEAVDVGRGSILQETRSVGNAPLLTVAPLSDESFEMSFGGEPVMIAPSLRQPELLQGRNVALAVRNGESAGQVLEWLKFHIRNQDLNGALIVSRSIPGSDPSFEAELRKGKQKSGLDCPVLIVEVDCPLGDKNLPAEAHPFCVPGAPGKDRMEIGEPCAWDSPLVEVLIYEWAHSRFLSRARAVVNIDVHDLLLDDDGPSVFDQAVNSLTGYIPLLGRHCYPWRLRLDMEPSFADHICIQFDATSGRRRWCVVPEKLPVDSTWRTLRIGGAEPEPDVMREFYRFMAIRHPTDSVSKIVPKTSLVEHEPLIAMMKRNFDHKPVRAPQEKMEHRRNGRCAIVTTMKNEGPFILEWIAYHRAIGFDDFLVYTNDCTDGTDQLLDVLQEKGVVQHRDNPFRDTDLKPQHAALQAAEAEPTIMEAEWVICMDVDEYINIKCGDGTLKALFQAVGDANMIALTWRLFGNADIHEFEPGFITGQFTLCAPELIRKPHQAWGFKTLFKNSGIFRKLGVHRPKGLKPQLWDELKWINGSGMPMPREMFRNGWRSTVDSYGYDLVQLNHYAVRSAESFLVKRDRGRVNHVDRDQGLAYWFRMNNNAVSETSICRMLPRLQQEFDALMQDADIAAAHNATLKAHREKIDELRVTDNYSKFFEELTGSRMQKLSRMHTHFGANVFLQGPESIPAEILERDVEDDFFFTVEKGDTDH